MKIPPFTLERWQSIWENQIAINLSESGVHPLSLDELVIDKDELAGLLRQPLGYPQTNGSELLRQRVAALYPDATAANVLMTSGCSEANFVITWSLLEAGDEVVFMQPNYMQVAGIAEAFGAIVRPLWLRADRAWGFDPKDLRQAVNRRTKLIAICNPNNPTGAVMTVEAMREVCDRAAEVGAWILADEVYRGAELEGEFSPSFWGGYERVLCTGGLSKAYGLPGLRTGWIVGPAEIIEKLWGVHDYTSIGISMLTDKLAAIALEEGKRRWILERSRRILNQNYKIVKQWISERAGLLRHIAPRAGGIAWIGYNHPWSADQLVEELRKAKDVLLVPGTQFGMDQYFRVGFAGDPAQLQIGLNQLADLLSAFDQRSGAPGV